MPIWQLCVNLLIPNCLRSNLSYSPLAALELYVNKSNVVFVFLFSDNMSKDKNTRLISALHKVAEMVDRMFTDSKNAALKEIHAKLDERLRNMNTSIAIKMNEVKNAKCGESRQRLNDEKGRLEEIERNVNDNQFNAEQERKRTTSILVSMASEIKSCYLDVFGIPYAEELATI